MNLNELLEGLEQTSGIEKQASSIEVVKPAISDELSAVLEKKADQDMTKVAFAEGEKLAKELLEKLANELQSTNEAMAAQDAAKIVPVESGTVSEVLKGTVEEAITRGATSDDLVDKIEDQTKQAQENKEMANAILEKIAQTVGEATTTSAAAINVEGAAVPNKIQEDNAAMTAFDDAKVQPLPGADGTINNILEAIVAGAKAQGGGSDDLVNGEGPTEGSAAIGVKAAEEQEKAAAVSALTAEGMDFDTAVALVKQAEAEILGEAFEQEKQAAFTALVESGINFDQAVELIKQAEEDLKKKSELDKEAGIADMARSALKGAKVDMKVAGANVKEILKGTGKPGGRASAANSLASTTTGKLVGGAVIGTAAYKAKKAIRGQEKKAAFDTLIEAGIDFEDAITLVKAAELDVYGE